MKIISIIPARMGSSRFPGKPLAKINGIPMIQHVYRNVKKSKIISEVVVATCDKIIFDFVRSINGIVIMTSKKHKRASDRCYEALRIMEKRKNIKYDIVVMVQGDEPMINLNMIHESIQPLLNNKKVNVVNLMSSINNQKDFDDLRLEWKDQLSLFKAIFFQERQRLRSEDLNSWIDLHEVYGDVIGAMKDLNDQGRLLIATLKDCESVRIILQRNGIDIFSKDILDQSQISSKLEALNYFVIQRKINKDDLCFIDDNITHLIKPHNYGYKVLLSGWGETILEHKIIAKENNIPIITSISKYLFS